MFCSRTVFRCFKTLERLGDRITGAAGPYFVAFAVILVGLGTVCFFDVIMPSLRWPLITGPICVLIALNLHMHYFYVVTIPPGWVEDPPRDSKASILWATKKSPAKGALTGVRWSSELVITRAAVTKCRKCGQVKPERAHHCRICNHCVLKYDHHCPGVNQCVGLHNERHFVLFMAYLVIACVSLSISGFSHVLRALGTSFDLDWPHHVPQIAFILIYILAIVMSLAVGIMCSYHLWTIANGETTVESQDHEIYRKIAKSRNETFVNSYDLGKRRNLELFFNIGENGYPFYTLLLPLRINPYTDGRSWARREGYDQHRGVRQGEELTDEDDNGEPEDA
ncbi:DHHC palmitoyltransferase-domain-containing protein [Mycena rebaudengoi]|nr:DHHC palmitoyltransferase-domain-containing protein [Mycena rebaudengoi]